MATEISKTLNSLYPDLSRAGGLATALQLVLDGLSPGMRVTDLDPPRMFVYANIRTGSRSSQVYVAAHDRAFSVDFWNQGVQYGTGWTRDLNEAGRAVVGFHVELATVEAMSERFAWFKVSQRAALHERGPQEFVAAVWKDLEHWLGTQEAEGSIMRRLFPLLVAASQRPELKRLYPFTSMDRLCFSRTTGFPFTQDCPISHALEEGRFRVLAPSGGTLGERTATEAADLIVGGLPPSCGPARHGTSDDGLS